jgi:methylglutaconyl-CoA hydratase
VTAPEVNDAGSVNTILADGIATVTFFHPKGNSLPGPLLKSLAQAFVELSGNREARAIVLRSEGTGPFCAGASFDELRAIRNEEQGTEFFIGFARLILAMRRCPQFVVARVHGKIVGGGVGLVAAADYAIAHSHATLRLSELAVGIGPFVVGPAIERKIGNAAFSALAVDADWRDAAWGERHGLYSRIGDTEPALDALTNGLAHRLSRANPESMARLKRTFWAGTDHWETLLMERAAMSGRLVLSDFTRRAIEEFAARTRS